MNTSIENNKASAEPELTDWAQINWRKVSRYVERLQKRIFHAESVGNKRKVRALQRLLMRSRAALLVSIRRVTQINKGKRTAGVDGFKVLTPEARLALFMKMKGLNLSLHKPKPAYRTYIKKKNGKLRPLGIPTIKDRVYQNVVKLALEPQWEAKFEPTSYGFRPKRSCQDAIRRIHQTMKGKNNKKEWVFEGDFKGCFDTLNHEYIIQQIQGFPETKLIARWLKAGYVDNAVFNETTEGTPQGGIVSPLLANIALHGMEAVLGIKYTLKQNKGKTTYLNHTRYAMCRYADDFVIMCATKGEAEELHTRLKGYLSARGLQLSDEKTKITHIEDGFDFLGFNIRRYTTHKGHVLLVKPSKSSMKNARIKIAEVVRKSHGNNVDTLINRINPIIIGTANYWCRNVAKRACAAIDAYVWQKTFRFLCRLHPTKGRKWIRERYYKPDKTGQSNDKWILTAPNTENQLKKMAWTPIVRHDLIKYNFSPFDCKLKEYFDKREKKDFDVNNIASRQKMAKRQKYKCPFCGMSIANQEEGLEVHHVIPREHGGKDEYSNLRLVHTSCHIEYHRKFPAKGELPPEILSKAYCQMIRTRRLAGLM